jgi:hypothetical protein
VSIYLLLYHRHLIVRYALTGVIWLAGFIVYSWHNFGQVMPNYYRANRLHFDVLGTALPGNLISPARGLLIYVPVVLFIGFLLVRYWRYIPFKNLAVLSVSVCVAYLIIISGFSHWWGGASFGPRLSTDIVPWLLLLAILGVKGMLRWREERQQVRRSRAFAGQVIAGVSLLLVSVFINGRGAISRETWRWNEQPKDVRLMVKKLWDWRQPQFLAGLISPPLEHDYPLVDGVKRVEFATTEADRYLWYGWSGPEDKFRWSEATEAALVFGMNRPANLTLKMKLAPFVSGKVHDSQRVAIEVNGQNIGKVLLTQAQAYELTFEVPKEKLAARNVLTFKLPDAESPAVLKLSIDERPLGIAVEWIEFDVH